MTDELERLRQFVRDVSNLLGKDYFTVSEAAHYACVSESQFRAKAQEFGIPVVKWNCAIYMRDIARYGRWRWRPQGDSNPCRRRERAGFVSD